MRVTGYATYTVTFDPSEVTFDHYIAADGVSIKVRSATVTIPWGKSLDDDSIFRLSGRWYRKTDGKLTLHEKSAMLRLKSFPAPIRASILEYFNNPPTDTQ